MVGTNRLRRGELEAGAHAADRDEHQHRPRGQGAGRGESGEDQGRDQLHDLAGHEDGLL